jgi:hypothetical protein
MAQALKSDPDEAVNIDPDENKEDLRAELLILLDELKRWGSGAVAEIEIFLNDTYAQPALEGWIWRMEKVKASLFPCPAAQQLQQTVTALVPQQKGNGPCKGGLKSWTQ